MRHRQEARRDAAFGRQRPLHHFLPIPLQGDEQPRVALAGHVQRHLKGQERLAHVGARSQDDEVPRAEHMQVCQGEDARGQRRALAPFPPCVNLVIRCCLI